MVEINVDSQELLQARLAQGAANLRQIPIVTREDIVAEVYSELNGVLALGNDVSPLRPIAREAPAIADDVQENFQTLNQDAQGIAQQLLDVENSAAGLYNLFASSQNNLRQMIREQLYQPSQRRYSEEFINSKRLDAQTSARIDYNAGVATAPLLKETAVIPDSAKTGVASVGSSTTDIGLLLDGRGDGLRLDRQPGGAGVHLQLPADRQPGFDLVARTSGAHGSRVHIFAGWRLAGGSAGRSAR